MRSGDPSGAAERACCGTAEPGPHKKACRDKRNAAKGGALVYKQSLMELVEGNDGGAVFRFAADLGGTESGMLVLDAETWMSFGRPREVTVAIKPGAHVGDVP